MSRVVVKAITSCVVSVLRRKHTHTHTHTHTHFRYMLSLWQPNKLHSGPKNKADVGIAQIPLRPSRHDTHDIVVTWRDVTGQVEFGLIDVYGNSEFIQRRITKHLYCAECV